MLKCVNFTVNQHAFYFFAWNRRKPDCRTPGENRNHGGSESPAPSWRDPRFRPNKMDFGVADSQVRVLAKRSQRQMKNALDEPPVFCGLSKAFIKRRDRDSNRRCRLPDIPD